MANRFYSPREAWVGRTHIARNQFGKNDKIITHWMWGDGGSPDSPVAKLRQAYLDGLAAVDDLQDRRSEVEASKKFTALGISELTGEHALTDSLPKLRRARAAVEKIKAEMAERAAKLTLAKPKNQDERDEQEEIRSAMRTMTPQQRDEFLKSNRHDPAVASAIANAIPALSGVHPSMHANIVQEQLQREHGDAFGELADLEEVAKTTERVTTLGRDELRETIGVAPQLFEQIAQAAEANAGELPYRTEQQVVNGQPVEIAKVYDFEARRWRDAQPQEIAATNGRAA